MKTLTLVLIFGFLPATLVMMLIFGKYFEALYAYAAGEEI